MAGKMNWIKCPKCGADLPIEEGRTQLFCSYCGTKIITANEEEQIYRRIEKVELKKENIDNKEVLTPIADTGEPEAVTETSIVKILTIMWAVLSFIILTVCISKMAKQGPDFSYWLATLFLLGVPLVAGGAYLFFGYIPKKKNEKILMSKGGIRFPRDLVPFAEKNYEAVQTALQSVGFRNITCINLHDLVFGLLVKPGTIESISVNGEKIMSGGKIYMPNVPITITYHGI